MHHHKQLYHHRGREGQDEAGSRSQANFMWNGDSANQYAGRSWNYADGAGASTLEGMGCRYAGKLVCSNIYFRKPCVLSFIKASSNILVNLLAVVKTARYHGEDVRRRPRYQAKVRRAGVA